ncbi:MAG: c-type cytochrome [Betaproteobacteria bacterium]
MKVTKPLLLAAALSLCFSGAALAAVNEDAAKELGKSNDCFKCHSVDKTKKGPSYKKIAAKFKGNADAEAKIIKNLTTGPKVKLEDGTEEDHKIIDTKDPKELKNLIDWILSR